jgi:hypothetical protein
MEPEGSLPCSQKPALTSINYKGTEENVTVLVNYHSILCRWKKLLAMTINVSTNCLVLELEDSRSLT